MNEKMPSLDAMLTDSLARLTSDSSSPRSPASLEQKSITFKVPPSTQEQYELLQKKTRNRFGKDLNKLLQAAVELAAKKAS